MNTTPPLAGSHLRTYERIFQHPISHNLEWRDVHSLFAKLGSIEKEPNGNFKVTRNGQNLVLHSPRTKDVAEMDDVMTLRHFLEHSEKVASDATEKEIHWLVVIDHHEARIFRSEMADAVPQRILPHEPSEYFRHAHSSRETSRGKEKPDPNTFFEPVAKVLGDKGQILIFGTGTGTSNEMDQFLAWLKIHHAEVNRRVIGSAVVDEHHLTEGQLLTKAREFYAKSP